MTIRKRAERKQKKEEKERVEEQRKKQKLELERRFKHIAIILNQKGYTKLKVPTLNQIKRYLKKEKKLSKMNLASIDNENVIDKWNEFV